MRPIYQQIADDLRAQIRRGDFKPGERLPSETMLVAEYQVAQGTVRQAVAVLRAENLVIAEHGRGVFVHDPSAEGDETVIEQVARHLYLTLDQQYDHRFVRWDRTDEHGLAQYDPDTQRRYRTMARQIVAVVHKAERNIPPGDR